jgi:hypothetical protein
MRQTWLYVYSEKEFCLPTDVSVPSDTNALKRKAENTAKHKNLPIKHSARGMWGWIDADNQKCYWKPTKALSISAARVLWCGICGGHSGSREGFIHYFSFPCQLSFHSLQYSFIILSSTPTTSWNNRLREGDKYLEDITGKHSSAELRCSGDGTPLEEGANGALYLISN